MSNESPNSLYKYVSFEGLKWILDGSIRFTQPSAFNDPFEFLPEIISPPNIEEKRIGIGFDISSPRQRFYSGSTQTIPKDYIRNDIISRDIVWELNKKIGVLCLSKKRDSLLMWSHYANQYAGAIVEFDGHHPFLKGQVEVEYLTERPRKLLSEYMDTAPIRVADLCAKSQQWEYEEEVRIIRSLDDCRELGKDQRDFPVFVKTVPTEAIKSIILGERMPTSEKKEVFLKIMDTNISLFLAAIGHSDFKFREERIKCNVPFKDSCPVITPKTAHIFVDFPDQLGALAKVMIEKHPLSKVVNRPI